MKILIAGNGKVGVTLTRKLLMEGHDLTLIDNNQKVLDDLIVRYDVMAVAGNCAAMQVLKMAGVMGADLLIAATGHDEINMLCCMTAHAMNPSIHTIARIRNPEYSDQMYNMRDFFALSYTVNPEKAAAKEIERLIKYPGFLHRDTFAKGRVEIVELKIDAGSRLCNVALNDLNNTVRCKVLVCTVLRNNEVIIPGGDFVLMEGDRVYITAPTNVLSAFLKNMGIITKKIKSALLCGGGMLSVYLAKELAKGGLDVVIMEKDHKRCEELATILPEISILEGDASSQFQLESSNINHFDAVVTLTGIDEINMIISLYAKTCEVPVVITKVGHTENNVIQNRLSLGSVVCPKELTSSNIVRYIRAMQNKTGAAKAVYGIAEGRCEAMEFVVDSDTKNCDTPLKKIKIRKNVLIACITHQNNINIPNGDSVFTKGDTLIVVASGVVIQKINDIFE